MEFAKNDFVIVPDTPYMRARQGRGELKGADIGKKYVVAEAYRVFKKWKVKVLLENGKISDWIDGSVFEKC